MWGGRGIAARGGRETTCRQAFDYQLDCSNRRLTWWTTSQRETTNIEVGSVEVGLGGGPGDIED